MLTSKLMELTIVAGSEWVMVLLLCLSVISISVVVERAFYFRVKRKQLDSLDSKLHQVLLKRDSTQIRAVVHEGNSTPLTTAVCATQAGLDLGATERLVAGELGRERLQLEKRLAFLGTLGNNAPFIGLFGTVLGIIRAFHDLSIAQIKGTSAVMAGISEALVATAIGLFVAIPAVIAFNYFQKQADRVLSITEALVQNVLGIPEMFEGLKKSKDAD